MSAYGTISTQKVHGIKKKILSAGKTNIQNAQLIPKQWIVFEEEAMKKQSGVEYLYIWLLQLR